MGTGYADITLTNAGDKIKARCGFITEPEVRRTTVTAVVDTGAATLFITEAVCQQLGLVAEGERVVRLRRTINKCVEFSGAKLQGNSRCELHANGGRIACKVTEPVEIRWKERFTTCPAVVMPGAETILLGAIPLEDMDVIVNPVKQVLEGAHGDEIVALALQSVFPY